MKKKYLLLTIVSIIGVLLAEFLFSNGFYEYTKSDLDLRRLPLIEPCEIFSIHKGEAWVVNENSNINLEGVMNKKLNQVTVDSLALFRNRIIFLFENNHRNYWLLYDPELQKAELFPFRAQLLKKMSCHEIALKSPETVFQNFKKSPNEVTLRGLIEIVCE